MCCNFIIKLKSDIGITGSCSTIQKNGYLSEKVTPGLWLSSPVCKVFLTNMIFLLNIIFCLIYIIVKINCLNTKIITFKKKYPQNLPRDENFSPERDD